MKALCSFFALAALCAAPAFATVTVTKPVNGANLSSPFTLSATASPCSSQAISAMGYSLDLGATSATVKGASINVSVTATSGIHTLHVKSWGTGGAACTTNVSITVAQATTTNVTVSSPLAGATVLSPFSLIAAGTLCSGQAITSMGYSVDATGATTSVSGTAIKASVPSTAGGHTLHVKSWGKSGSFCVKDVAISVQKPSTGPSIPANAVAQKLIQNLTKWTGEHDAGTPGSSSGTMNLVTSPALSATSRKFATSYTNYGGERYNVDLTLDQLSTNFVYDAQIYMASPSSDVSNIEMDLNQVTANGQTVIFGFQCDGWSKTWDYASNIGTIAVPNAHWTHSNQTCNPQKWATNTWHHVQVQYSRDSSGNVTYDAVWLDGVEQDLNVTVLSAFGLGWGPTLNTNFQIDGFTSTSGSSTIYLDNMTLYGW